MTLMIFRRLRAGSESYRREQLFRIFGYGTIILLMSFLWFSFFFQSSNWSKTTGEMLVYVLCVIVVSALTALTVLSWLQTEEETSGQTLLAIIKLWPVLAWCLPSLLGLGLLLLSLSLAEKTVLSGPLYNSCFVWFLFVAPVTTLIAVLVFVRRKRTGRIAILPTLLACAVLFASTLADLFALLGLVLNGMSGYA
jgi:hypothetical protein